MTSTVTARTSPASSAATATCPADNMPEWRPDVNLIDLRALDANGAGSDSTVIAAIQQAIALKNTYNIRVINLSLGRGIPVSYTQDPSVPGSGIGLEERDRGGRGSRQLRPLERKRQQRLRNRHRSGQRSLVLTVGATKSNGSPTAARRDQMASYSSKGPTTYDHVVKPDIVAPGNAIVSLCRTWSHAGGCLSERTGQPAPMATTTTSP